jgi:hypothetical protein
VETFVLYGTAPYGYVDNNDGTTDATRFFHVFFVPLVPLEPVRIGRGQPCWRPRSVLYAFIHFWVFLGAMAAGISGIKRGSTLGIAIPAVVALAAVTCWFRLGRRPDYKPSVLRQLLAYAVVSAIFAGGLFHFPDKHRAEEPAIPGVDAKKLNDELKKIDDDLKRNSDEMERLFGVRPR